MKTFKAKQNEKIKVLHGIDKTERQHMFSPTREERHVTTDNTFRIWASDDFSLWKYVNTF